MQMLQRFPVAQIPFRDLCLTETNLGEGGSGVVVKGTWKDVTVAVKKLNSEILKDTQTTLDRELKSLGIFREHPNIVKLVGCSTDGPDMCILYEMIEGGTVERAILRQREKVINLNWAHYVSFLVDIATGLQFMHSNGVVHLDIKPSNVLLCFSPTSDASEIPRAKIGDFGVSLVLPEYQHVGVATHMTITRPAVSLAYADPQYVKDGKASKAVDIYSLV